MNKDEESKALDEADEALKEADRALSKANEAMLESYIESLMKQTKRVKNHEQR